MSDPTRNEVIPSHHPVRTLEAGVADPLRWGRLYVGEVLGVIYPEDKGSITQKFVEYRVVARVGMNGTIAYLEFPHAVLANPLAGLADKAIWTLRADPKSGEKGKPGLGSKVLVQCLNGDFNNAVIVGGARDPQDDGDDGADKGHHLDLVFNGVEMEVADDGSLTITRNGPTKSDGDLDEDKADKDTVGTYVTLDAAGGLKIATVRGDDEEQTIVLDHDASTMTLTTKSGFSLTVDDGPIDVKSSDAVTVDSDADVTVKSGGDVTITATKGQIHLGAAPGQPIPLGQDLAQFLQDLIQAISQVQVGTAIGPSSPPLNAPAFLALLPRIPKLLSQCATVKETP